MNSLIKLTIKILAIYKRLSILDKKGQNLCNFYNADKELVSICICLMDINLKEALEQGKQQEHILMALEFAQEFLKNYDLPEKEFKTIIECIKSHHGTDKYNCIESEICANDDCYIFIHPNTGLLVKRGKTLEEQYKNLSLDQAKEEWKIITTCS